MHLLMETAIGDSAEYEILSIEKVDEIKKECSFLNNRIEATRRKLILESKLRDAAQSLNRLNSARSREGSVEGSPNPANKHRRSIMGSRGSGSDLLSKTDDELSASTKKCEVLAQELWRLEKRLHDLQTKLLQHTSGILQLTHEGVLKKGQTPNMLPSGLDSVDVYPFGLGSFRSTEYQDDFDDRSLYFSLDGLDKFGDSNHQRGDSKADFSADKAEFVQQKQAIVATEMKLEDLNHRLREMIAKTNLEQNESYSSPPKRQPSGNAEQPGAILQAQLDYLATGLSTLDSHDEVSRNVEQSMYATEERLEDINARLYSLLRGVAPGQSQLHQPPPPMNGQSPEAQCNYLRYGLDILNQHLQDLAHATQASSKRTVGHQEKAEQFETVVKGLWEIMIAGEEDARQGRERDNRDGSLSHDEDIVSHEGFSLPSFSTKVQSLYAQATGLQEQKDILKRQIQQQRELNSKSDAQKDTELTHLTEELESTKARLESTHQQVALMEQQKGMVERDASHAEAKARQETEERISFELGSRQDEISGLRDELQRSRAEAASARANMQESEWKIEELMDQLDGVTRSKEAAEGNETILRTQVADKTKEVEVVQAEIGRLEGEVVRLQTEVTVARAELDGAYGTRAQRAAEVAANPALQRELDELAERNMSLLKEIASLKSQHTSEEKTMEMQTRIETLQRELTETIGEYENMIKSSIEFEKEREHLESMIDGLRDRCEALDTQLSEEKVKSLGTRSSLNSNGPTETTSTMVLKNEFKKMMRDTRAENIRALRVSDITTSVKSIRNANIWIGRARGATEA